VNTARTVSAIGTAVPVALGTGAILISAGDGLVIGGIIVGGLGLIYGPSSGHAYAGNTWRFFSGSSLRILSVGVGLGGLYIAAAGALAEYGEEDVVLPGLILAAASTGFLVFTIIKDFNDLDNSVNRYNQKHGLAFVNLKPTYFPRQKAAGLMVSVQF
jgi:hypothetical protein